MSGTVLAAGPMWANVFPLLPAANAVPLINMTTRICECEIAFGELERNRGAVDENLIIDVGMHTGRDTEFYLKKGFHVAAVEAPIAARAGIGPAADGVREQRQQQRT